MKIFSLTFGFCSFSEGRAKDEREGKSVERAGWVPRIHVFSGKMNSMCVYIYYAVIDDR